MSTSQAGPSSPAPGQQPEGGNRQPPAFQNRAKTGGWEDGIELYLFVSPPDSGHFWQWAVSVHHWRHGYWESYQMPSEPGVPALPVRRLNCDPRRWPGCREMRPFANVPESSFASLMFAVPVVLAGLTHVATRPSEGGSGIDIGADPRSQDFAMRLARQLVERGFGTEAGLHAAQSSLGQYMGRQDEDVGRPRGGSAYPM